MIGKALVACEESQAVCIALRAKGWEAYSCDILPCSGGHPEWHMQDDCLDSLYQSQYGIKISFPPCTDLSVSGAKHFDKKRADGRQAQSIKFFLNVYRNSDALENPIGIMNKPDYIKKWFPKLYEYAVFIGFPFKPTQIIQPYMFGDPFTKTTCLWLKGLPKLTPTNIVDKGRRIITKGGNSLPEWYNIPPTDPDRSKKRSKTFPGIARAMADQWTNFYIKQICEL